MAYSKLFYVNADFILGYQTVNQGVDNLDAVYDAMSTLHKNTEEEIGKHDTPMTARALTTVAAASLISSGIFLPAATSSEIGSPSRISTGVYFVPVIGLATFWGTAVASVSSSTPAPFIQCQTIKTGNTGVMVRCYELGAGAFTLTDFDFFLGVHGETSG